MGKRVEVGIGLVGSGLVQGVVSGFCFLSCHKGLKEEDSRGRERVREKKIHR